MEMSESLKKWFDKEINLMKVFVEKKLVEGGKNLLKQVVVRAKEA